MIFEHNHLNKMTYEQILLWKTQHDTAQHNIWRKHLSTNENITKINMK